MVGPQAKIKKDKRIPVTVTSRLVLFLEVVVTAAKKAIVELKTVIGYFKTVEFQNK